MNIYNIIAFGIILTLVVFWWYLMNLVKIFYDKSNFTLNLINNNSTVFLTFNVKCLDVNSFEEILDILDEKNIKATFFIMSEYIDSIEKRNLLIRAVKSNHHLANHGKKNYPHILYNEVEFINEIIECENLIESIYVEANVSRLNTKYFRPNGIFVNSIIKRVCKVLGYKIILGTISLFDLILPFPNLLAWILRKKTKQNDIIMLNDKNWTPSVLKKSLEELSNKYLISSLK